MLQNEMACVHHFEGEKETTVVMTSFLRKSGIEMELGKVLLRDSCTGSSA